MLTYDKEFLYLAMRCLKSPQASYAPPLSTRDHDANLSQHDHVQLTLDLDRDYATWFQFAVDHRGQTADACWHDSSWNPQWYVAAGSDPSYWTVEAAISWAELTSIPPRTGDAWLLTITRLLPIGTAEVWQGPAFATPHPENFGLLLFQ